MICINEQWSGEMDRNEFLDAIFAFFKVKDEEKTQYKAYDLALSKGRNIDWDRMYLKTIESVETRYLPAPKFFLNLFPSCQRISFQQSKFMGYKVRIHYSNGKYTDYVVSGFGLNKEKILKNKNVNVVKMVMYPPTTTLIGKNIIPEDSEYNVLYAI